MNSKAQQSKSYLNRIIDRYIQHFIINKDYRILIHNQVNGSLVKGSFPLYEA
jgi:hypothetical protein